MSPRNTFPTFSRKACFPSISAMSLRVVALLAFILLSLPYQSASVFAQTGQQSQPQLLTGHENHKISLPEAAKLTRNFRNSPGNDQTTIIGEFFGKDALSTALAQANCVGLRIYYGKRDDGTPVLVFVGVDKSGHDMADGFVGEEGLLCPPVCHEMSPLSEDEFATMGPYTLQFAEQDKGQPK